MSWPSGWSTTWSGHDPEFDFDAELERFIVRGERTAFGPSTQAIVDEAVSRDIPYLRLNTASLVQLGQGVHAKRIRATMTSQTSSVAVDIASNKELTLNLLSAAGLPVPRSESVRTVEDAVPLANRIGYPVVLKPLDGNHGRGVMLDLRSDDDVRAAFPVAKEESRNGLVIVETFVTGRDYRCLVIDGRIAAIAERVPAHVVGDGRRDRHRAGRADQRRPAPRGRAREGADPDQGRPGGRRPGPQPRGSRWTTCRPRAPRSSSP